jgi:hypothetical protein
VEFGVYSLDTTNMRIVKMVRYCQVDHNNFHTLLVDSDVGARGSPAPGECGLVGAGEEHDLLRSLPGKAAGAGAAGLLEGDTADGRAGFFLDAGFVIA